MLSNERTTLLFQQLKSYSEKEKKLSPFYQDVQRLQNQVSLFHGISTGQSLSVMPNPESTTWFTLAELSGEDADSFKAITDQLIKATTEAVKAKDSATKEAVQGLKTQVDTYIERILQNDTHHVVDMNKIKAEVFLNSFEPFLKSWIFYLLFNFR